MTETYQLKIYLNFVTARLAVVVLKRSLDFDWNEIFSLPHVVGINNISINSRKFHELGGIIQQRENDCEEDVLFSREQTVLKNHCQYISTCREKLQTDFRELQSGNEIVKIH